VTGNGDRVRQDGGRPQELDVGTDGLLWIAIPVIAVGLWLAHDGFQSPAVVVSQRPSQLLLRLQDYLVQADLERWTPWRVLLLSVVSASFGGLLVGWAGWGWAGVRWRTAAPG